MRRDRRLTEATRRVLGELESYADADGTNARPGNQRIADALETGTEDNEYLSISSVERALRLGQELGYIMQTEKGGRRKINGVVVKRASVWKLTMPLSPVTQMKGDSRGDEQITRQSAPNDPSFEPLSPVTQMKDHQSLTTSSNTPAQKHSVGASSDRAEEISVDASATPNPEPLDIWWSPNHSHRKSAEDKRVDIEDAARRFRRWANLEGFKPEKRSNWDSTFGNFINASAAGTSDRDYKGSGDHYGDMHQIEILDATPVAASVFSFPTLKAVAIDGSDPSSRLEQMLTKVGLMTGPLSEAELELATDLTRVGRNFSEVAGEIEISRERERARSAA